MSNVNRLHFCLTKNVQIIMTKISTEGFFVREKTNNYSSSSHNDITWGVRRLSRRDENCCNGKGKPRAGRRLSRSSSLRTSPDLSLWSLSFTGRVRFQCHWLQYFSNSMVQYLPVSVQYIELINRVYVGKVSIFRLYYISYEVLICGQIKVSVVFDEAYDRIPHPAIDLENSVSEVRRAFLFL